MRRPALGWTSVVAAACGASGPLEGPASESGETTVVGGSATTDAAAESSAEAAPPDLSSGAAPETGDSTGGDTTDGGDVPALPSIGPTMATLELDFRVAISGTGSLLVGGIDLLDGVGTIDLEDRTLPVFVFERQPWPEQGYTLYQALAVEDDGWTLLWFYCDDFGALGSVYLESTHGIPLQSVFAEGMCEVSLESVDVPLDLPGTEFSVLYNGEPFEIDGPDIGLTAGALGEVTLQGVPYVVAPFETVDCSQDCGTPGWYEVHVLLWDPSALRAGFSIVYLESEGTARMTYGITLPDLTDPVGDTFLDATWSFG